MLSNFFDKIINKIVLNSNNSGLESFLGFLKKIFPIFSSEIEKYLTLIKTKSQSIRNQSQPNQSYSQGPIDNLSIILTHKCNLKCEYCLRDAGANKEEISFPILERIILSAHRAGCRVCGITGGEAILHPKFNELINLISSLKWSVLLETNGKIFTSEICDFLKEKLFNGLSILVSLDSYTKEKHDIFRGSGSFDLAVKAIKIIKSRNIRLLTNAIITDMEEEELIKLVHFNKTLKVDSMNINRAVPLGRGKNNKFLLSTAQVNDFNSILKKHNFFDGYVVEGAFGFNYNQKRTGCQRMMKHICVSPTGVHPCLFHEALKIGELKDFEKIIWNENLRNFMISTQKGVPLYCEEKGIPFSCFECVDRLPDFLSTYNNIKKV